MPSGCASRSPSSNDARSCSATRVHRSSACCGSGPSDLEAREAELTAISASLTERETRAHRGREHDLARRRQELGAVELKRAAVERRERAVAARESELAERESAAVASRRRLPRAGHRSDRVVELVFVPGERYRLVEIDATTLTPGVTLRRRGRGVRRGADRPRPRCLATRGAAPTSCAVRDSLSGGSSGGSS